MYQHLSVYCMDIFKTSDVYSEAFRRLFMSYTKAFNKQNNRKGSLFMPRFNRKLITSNEYLQNAINYIHQNPISHNFVAELDEWSYSSCIAIIDNKPTKINTDFVVKLFDDKENFIAYHKVKSIEKYSLDMNLSY